jgi:amino acid adenylation domain-containing protein
MSNDVHPNPPGSIQESTRRLLKPSAAFVPFLREDVEQSIPARFEQMARRYPDHLAVRTSQHDWTYNLLNREANRLAHALLRLVGAGRSVVVILIEQSAPLIAAYLGAMKAGKIAVVLDPSQPSSRLAEFMAETQPTCVVAHANQFAQAVELAGSTCPTIRLDQLAGDLSDSAPDTPSAPGDPATILYTSGSTGRPKGVIADHRTWIHNARNYANTFYISCEDRVTLLSLGTSQAVKNICMALLNGAGLFPFEVRQRGLDAFLALLEREKITITVMGASLFRSLSDVLPQPEQLTHLRLIRLGSEPVQRGDLDLYKKHFPAHCLLVNGLASGETATTRFYCVDHNREIAADIVPVGYPVEDKTILLLDDDGKEVAPGQVGEIVVKSEYLAPGYWRNPEQTEAVFRPGENPTGARSYFTGDLGRMDQDGCLTCLGRKNARVKIRGYGVDLIEVEIAMTKLDPVKEAVVMAHQNSAGYAYLVAYIVPMTLPGPTNHALRQALSETLPDYMVPTTFVILGALPRTTSGKIDRQTLPAPGRPYRDLSRPLTLPRSPIETTIAKIWSEVLGHGAVDVHDHFYDLGGESLQALRIMAKIRQTFNVDVDIQSLIDAPTVAEMATQVTKLREARTDSHQANEPQETPKTIRGDNQESDPTWRRFNRTSAIFFMLWPLSL